jgi:hypothetical protein
LDRAASDKYARVAVVTRGELWKPQQLDLVRKFSAGSVVVDSQHEAALASLVPEVVLPLVA